MTHAMKVTQLGSDQIVSRVLSTCDCGIQVLCRVPTSACFGREESGSKKRNGREDRGGQGETVEERDEKEKVDRRREAGGVEDSRPPPFLPRVLGSLEALLGCCH